MCWDNRGYAASDHVPHNNDVNDAVRRAGSEENIRNSTQYERMGGTDEEGEVRTSEL